MNKSGLKKGLALILSLAMIMGQATTAYATEGAQLPEEEMPVESQFNEDGAAEASSESSEEVTDAASLEDSDITDKASEVISETDAEDTDEDAGEKADEASSEDSEETAGYEASTDLSVEIAEEASDSAELPEGVKGMPEGYTLTSDEIKTKKDLIAHDVLTEFENLEPGVNYISDQVICRADSREHADMIAQAYSGKLESYEYGVAVIDLSESPLDVGEAYSYGLDPKLGLPAVEPNYMRQIIEPAFVEEVDIPNLLGDSGDSSVGDAQTWEMLYNSLGNPDPFINPTNPVYQWHLQYIHAYAAWNVTRGSSDITVAVIDTGFTNSHEDFDASRIVTPLASANANGETNEADHNQNGASHGTHVAGIIGATLGNGKGGSGIAPGVKILPINAYSKVYDESSGKYYDTFTTDDLVKAIRYVAGYNPDNTDEGHARAQIVNMSLGGSAYESVTAEAIAEAYQRKVTVVVSMGNSSGNVITYPAGYDHVIAVGATSFDGKPTDFSSMGNWADVSAPGYDIYSTSWSDATVQGIPYYENMSGTSQASPIIAGACALYMSVYGWVKPDRMEEVIKKSVNPVSYNGMGTGIIDLVKLFDGDLSAPRITLISNDPEISSIEYVEKGEARTSIYGYTGNAQISISPTGFDGDAAANTNTKLIYTTDGTDPSTSDTAREYTGQFYVSSISSDIGEDGLITVKAMAITGMGIATGYTTLRFMLDGTYRERPTVTITGAPDTLVAGKSVTLAAKVTDRFGGIVNEKVTWEITSYTDGDLSGAAINASTGKLTTKAKQSGSLVITCTTVDTKASDSVTINVDAINPIKTLALDKSSVTLHYSYNAANCDYVDLNIKTLTDTKGNNLLTNGGWKNFGFRWTSSNESVATVTPTPDTGGPVYGHVEPVSAGTAKITCEALDGSGKKATVTVTVAGDKKIANVDIQFYGTSLTKASMFVKEDRSFNAILTDVDGKELADQKNNVIWTSSNAKAATVKLVYVDGVYYATVTGVGVGKTKITATAKDGSGKKAVLDLEVKQIPEKVTITGQDYVPVGGTANYKATVLPANSMDKTYKWVVGKYNDSNVFEPFTEADGITIDDKGKLSVADRYGVGTTFVIKAVANTPIDGTVYAEKEITIKPATTKIAFYGAREYTPGNELTSEVLGTKTMKVHGVETLYNNVIIYVATDNGTRVTASSSNPKVVSAEDGYYKDDVTSIVLTGLSEGKATITASALDASGVKAKFEVNVIEPVEEIDVTGQWYIPLGSSATYKASTILPKTASNKKVDWKVGTWNYAYDSSTGLPSGVTDVAGISIDQKGKVTVASSVSADFHDAVYVFAIAQDGSNVSGFTSFRPTNSKTSGITVAVTDPGAEGQECYKIVNKKGTLSSVQLFDVNAGQDLSYENRLSFKATVVGSNNSVKWSIDKDGIVEMSTISANIITLHGSAPGTATVTCAASDGSGKKTSFKVTVITPVSDIQVRPSGNNAEVVSFGKSMPLIATAGDAYGKPSNTKFTWSYEICQTKDYSTFFDDDGIVPISAEGNEVIKAEKKLFTMSGNKVSANKNYLRNRDKYVQYLTGNNRLFVIKAIATATDGSGVEGYRYLYPLQGSLSFSIFPDGGNKARSSYTFTYTDPENGYAGFVVATKVTKKRVRYGRYIYVYNIYENPGQYDAFYDWGDGSDPGRILDLYHLGSSNDSVASAMITYTSEEGVWIGIRTHGKGTAKITVTAKDGSNAKKTFTVKVK